MRVRLLVSTLLFLIPAVSKAAFIDGRDDGVLFGEGEIAFRLGSTPADSDRSRYNAISIGYTGTNAEYNSYLTTSNFTYPEPLHNIIKLRIGYLRFVQHSNFSRNFEFSWAAGLSICNYQHTSTLTTSHSYLEDRDAGLHAQVGLGYHLTRTLALGGNLSTFFFYDPNTSYLFGPQLQFSFTPVDTITLYAGYRNWFHYTDFHGIPVDVQSFFTGYVGGLRLTF